MTDVKAVTDAAVVTDAVAVTDGVAVTDVAAVAGPAAEPTVEPTAGQAPANDLAELKRFVVAHAISQQLPAEEYAGVLERITTDSGDRPGSWAYEWVRAGQRREAAGELLGACQYYTLGRFPFVDGPGRARSLGHAVAAFDRWRLAEAPEITPETVDVDGTAVRVWTIGLSAEQPRPLLVMTGGIVSPKEQWGAYLPQIAGFGMAGVVAELPGVGENPLRYQRESARLFPAILDAFADRARTEESYLLALSFSGHLAIGAALRDERIRGIVANGLPVRDFFTDAAWQRQVPRLTRDTLAHLAGTAPGEVFEHIRDWGLDEDAPARLRIPLAAVVARRDEIIPPGDAERLRAGVADLRLLEHDDVHGAPGHLRETALWSLLAVQRMRPDADPRVVAGLSAALAALGPAGAR
ncbi:esterase FrsA [Kitasatospora sp. NBC_01287]|uniref:alpha/beta hydrolase n=1 Tax=Kitasatospora sp. NBC_01287 TaxID=2903573 RepID=UPI00225A87F0|nr:alpha/beta hydrolase [Kitasatospora sp. NBC_01287]MCX4751626.1 esterase FrsA [Kitasatospora sp. NBC_01287]